MKRFFSAVATTLVIVFALSLGIASAADEVITGPIQSVVTKMDKNGQPYTRVIVAQQRMLAGVGYTAGTPVMFFGDASKDAENLKEGDTLKCIANGREYRGNMSYTAIKLLN